VRLSRPLLSRGYCKDGSDGGHLATGLKVDSLSNIFWRITFVDEPGFVSFDFSIGFLYTALHLVDLHFPGGDSDV